MTAAIKKEHKQPIQPPLPTVSSSSSTHRGREYKKLSENELDVLKKQKELLCQRVSEAYRKKDYQTSLKHWREFSSLRKQQYMHELLTQEEEYDIINTKYETLKEKYWSLKDEHDTSERYYLDQQTANETLVKEKTALQSQVELLSQKETQRSGELTKLNGDLTKVRTERNDLRAQLEEIKGNLELYKARREAIGKLMEDKEKAFAQEKAGLLQRIEGLEYQLNKDKFVSEAKIRLLEEEKKADDAHWKRRLDESRTEMDALSDEITKLSAEATCKKAKCDLQEQEIQRLKDQLTSAAQAQEEQRKNIEEQRKKLEEEQKKTMQDQNQTFEQQRKTIQDQNQRFDQMFREYKICLTERDQLRTQFENSRPRAAAPAPAPAAAPKQKGKPAAKRKKGD